MKAVIQTGGKQYIVEEDQVLNIELVDNKKSIEFDALLVIDGDNVKVGTPHVSGVKVNAEVVEPIVKGEKIKIRKFQAKKRVNTLTGHRQKFTQVKIKSIGTSSNKTVKSKPVSKKKTPANKATAKKK